MSWITHQRSITAAIQTLKVVSHSMWADSQTATVTNRGLQLSATSCLLCMQVWVSRVGLMSPPTQYRLSGRQFYRSKDPTNSIKVRKEKTLQKLNTTQKNKQQKIQQNKTSLVQSPHTTLGQETRWAYSTKLLSPHGAGVYVNESLVMVIEKYNRQPLNDTSHLINDHYITTPLLK